MAVAKYWVSGATVTESSTWPCECGARSPSPPGPVEDSVTVAPQSCQFLMRCPYVNWPDASIGQTSTTWPFS